MRSKTLIFAILGGALGALARVLFFAYSPENLLIILLICNALGSFLMSSALQILPKNFPLIRSFSSTGFCGGFTTLSTFAAMSSNIFSAGNYFLFFGFVFLSFASALLCAYLGELFVRGLNKIFMGL